MDFHEFDAGEQLHHLWNSVQIVRSVPYSLFTFGESVLPYFLIVDSERPLEKVEVSRGEVRITRPTIITPSNMAPEFRNFFENDEYQSMVDFMLARTAAFSHLKINNETTRRELASDSVDEVVARLNRKLDDEEEDRIALLTAPHGLGPVALLKYTAERVISSAPGNVQELRERGFLPE